LPVQEPVQFYFDFASPYGYFAATRIDGITERHGRTVVWRPILLGAVFKITGMQSTLSQPLRGDYLRHDVPRFARLLGLPLTIPESMPVSGVVPSRAYWWMAGLDEAKARRLARALMDAHWGQGRDISDPDVVAEVAEGLGVERGALEAGLQDEAVKRRLREETERAVALGVFGSPVVVVGEERFWGADRLDQVDRWLAGGW
jgi:2-hydroxychromene-2-carboxylate isomerase